MCKYCVKSWISQNKIETPTVYWLILFINFQNKYYVYQHVIDATNCGRHYEYKDGQM